MRKVVLTIIAVVIYCIQFKIIWDSNEDIKQLRKDVADLKKENEELFDELTTTDINEEEI